MLKSIVGSMGLVGALLLADCGASAHEAGAKEYGLDAAVEGQIVSGEWRSTLIGIPASNFRMGFFLTRIVEVEPAVSFALVSEKATFKNSETSTDSETRTDYGLGVSLDLVCNFSSEPRTPFLKVGPLVAVSGNESSSEGQFGVEGGAGIKLAFADRWATRIEAGVARMFERKNKLNSGWFPLVSVGISFFTK